MKAALKKGVESGMLIQVRASYKLSPEAKKSKPKAKKATAAKAKSTSTKKKAPAKKASSAKKVRTDTGHFVVAYVANCYPLGLC